MKAWKTSLIWTILMVLLEVGIMNRVNYLNADSGNYRVSENYQFPQPFPVGLSMYFDELMPFLNNTVLRGYINNSIISENFNNLFHQTIHFPLGYKYSCSQDFYPDVNITCLYELYSDFDTQINLETYLTEFNGGYSIQLGWDSQKINLTNPNYYANYREFFDRFSYVANIELIDNGDLMLQLHNTTYNINDYLRDIVLLQNRYYYNYVSGVGLSQNASSQWNE